MSYRLFDFTRYIPWEKAINFVMVPLVFNIMISYIHYFLLLPLLIKKKQWYRYIGFLIITLVVMVWLRSLAGNIYLRPLSQDSTYYATLHVARVLSILWDFATFLLFTGMIKFTVDWFYLDNRRKQLENEKLQAELNYLKAQINPHFLFNTLHNLNYLTLRKKEEASDVIVRLSNIMRYMIYDTGKPVVSIHKEIAYMKDYIELERIRLNREFNLTFNTNSVPELKIVPLLLITFLENAFKHGVSDQKPGCWISVSLNYGNGILNYQVSNSLIQFPQTDDASGFGMHNIKRRLELHYGGRHELKQSKTLDTYTIDLKIALDEH